MQRLYSAENVFDAYIVRDRLIAEGIDAVVHGEMLIGALGELPADTRPSVWIRGDADYAAARAVVEAFEQGPASGPDWRCPRCGETNAATFGLCWSCGGDGGDTSGMP